MYREDPWTMRYSSWGKGEWEDIDWDDLRAWMLYLENVDSYRLHRVSPSWMVFTYVGKFIEDRFHLIFHRRF